MDEDQMKSQTSSSKDSSPKQEHCSVKDGDLQNKFHEAELLTKKMSVEFNKEVSNKKANNDSSSLDRSYKLDDDLSLTFDDSFKSGLTLSNTDDNTFGFSEFHFDESKSFTCSECKSSLKESAFSSCKIGSGSSDQNTFSEYSTCDASLRDDIADSLSVLDTFPKTKLETTNSDTSAMVSCSDSADCSHIVKINLPAYPSELVDSGMKPGEMARGKDDKWEARFTDFDESRNDRVLSSRNIKDYEMFEDDFMNDNFELLRDEERGVDSGVMLNNTDISPECVKIKEEDYVKANVHNAEPDLFANFERTSSLCDSTIQIQITTHDDFEINDLVDQGGVDLCKATTFSDDFLSSVVFGAEENKSDTVDDLKRDKSVSFADELVDSKKDIDTNKAVTFADDIEIFDMTSVTHSPITVSLDTPVHLVDPAYLIQGEPVTMATSENDHNNIMSEDKNNKVFDEPEKGTDRDMDLLHNRSVEIPKSTDSIPADKVEDSPKLFHMESIQEVDDRHMYPSHEGKYPEETLQAATEDLGSHKEFVVISVDESELLNSDSQDKFPMVDIPLSPIESDKNLVSPSNEKSQSVESIRHDTIGPLDNPVFLRELQYSTSQHFEEEDQLDPPSPSGAPSLTVQQVHLSGQDEGWAWVVLVATCLAQVILGGSVYSAGVMLTAIVDNLDADLSKASWVGSVHVCALSFSGPVVGSCVNRFGSRRIVCLAGLVSCLGFLGAAFSTTVGQLVLTHGIIAGIGAGFTVNPIMVTVGQYFCRYRAMACGLLACGAGMGMLGGGAIMSLLVDYYGLSGAYIMWAGVVLHISIVGMLLRPSPVELQRSHGRKVDSAKGSLSRFGTDRPELMSMASGMNSLFSSVNHSMISGIDRVSQGRKQAANPYDDKNHPMLKSALSRSTYSVSTNHSLHMSYRASACPSVLSNSTMVPTGINSMMIVTTEGADAQPKLNNMTHHNNTHHSGTPVSNQSKPTGSDHTNYSSIPSTSKPQPTTGRRQRRLSSSSQYASTSHMSQYNSTSHVSQCQSLANLSRQNLNNESMSSTLVSQMRPRDSITPRHPLGSHSFSLMGSLAMLPTNLAMIKDDMYTEPLKGERALEGRVVQILESLAIFKNKAFLMFLVINIIWAFGESPFMIYLSAYAISRGTERMQAAFLYTTMGIGSMTGRLVSGGLAGNKDFGPVPLFMGLMGISGILILVCVHVTPTFPFQAVFSLVLGFYTGGIVPLVSLISIELLGLSELGLGFGFLCLAQGCGYLIGPPLAGVIVAAYGFSEAFLLSGIFFLLGSLLTLLMMAHIERSERLADEEKAYLHTVQDGAGMIDADSNINLSNCQPSKLDNTPETPAPQALVRGLGGDIGGDASLMEELEPIIEGKCS